MRGRLNDLFMSYWGGSAADPKFVNFFLCHSYIPRRFFYAFFLPLSLCRSCSSFLCYVIISLLLFVEFLTLESTVRTFGTISVLVEFLIPQQQQKSFLFDLARSLAAYRPSSFLPQSPSQPRVRALTNEQEQTHSTHTLLLRISSSTADHRASRRGGWEDIKT